MVRVSVGLSVYSQWTDRDTKTFTRSERCRPIVSDNTSVSNLGTAVQELCSVQVDSLVLTETSAVTLLNWTVRL